MWLKKTGPAFFMSLGLFFLLCQAAAPAATPTILPLGDSITYGYPNPGNAAAPGAGGYRDELFNELAAAHDSFTYVGSAVDNPSTSLTNNGETHHEGHSGYTITQIDNNLKGNDTSGNGGSNNNGGHWIDGGNGTGRGPISPDIVLLHIGTNDSSQGQTALQMAGSLKTLLDDLKSDLPSSAQVFVASLVPRTDNATVENTQQMYNSDIPSILLSEGSRFHFVDMHTAFENSGNVQAQLQSDGVHPSPAGYNLMGDTWFNAIAGTVPEPSGAALLLVAGAGVLARRRRR